MTSASMRSPSFVGSGTIQFIDKVMPEPGPGQLVIQIKANALCGSERGQFYQGSTITPGHEAVGTVISAGAGTSTPIGTPGVIFLMDYCGECRSCRGGWTNQCLDKRADMGFSHDGGYGPFELIHENIFFPLGPGADDPASQWDWAEVTMLLDIMGTGGHALERARLTRPDSENLLITGAGPIGLGVLAMAKITYGAQFPIAITDVSPYRLRLAEQLGGIPVNVALTDLKTGLSDYGLTSVDCAIDTSGKGAARQMAMEVVGKRGGLVCVGHGEGLTLEVSRDLIAPEHTVIGSEYFRYNELAHNLELFHAYRGYLSQIITHRMPVADIQAAFTLFFAGATGKVVVEQ